LYKVEHNKNHITGSREYGLCNAEDKCCI